MDKGKYHKSCLLFFSRRTGKVATTYTGLGTALLRMTALQYTKKSQNAAIVDLLTGEVPYYYTGNGDFPKEEKDKGQCDEVLAEGLLDALRNETPDWQETV